MIQRTDIADSAPSVDSGDYLRNLTKGGRLGWALGELLLVIDTYVDEMTLPEQARWAIARGREALAAAGGAP